MNKKVSLILICALFLALMGGALALYGKFSAELPEQNLAPAPTETDTPGSVEQSPDAEETPEDALAPDFTGVDMDGTEVTLSDFRGKPVVLNFWASWCGPCKMEMPDFQQAYETYGDEIHFLMVNLTDGGRETVEIASDFIARQGYTFPVYFDTNYSAAMAYATNAIPVTFFIGAEGEAVAYGQGALDAATLQRGIDMIHSK